MSERNDFLAELGQTMKAARKNAKSDDIIEFIRANWRLFTSTKSEMNQAMSMLGSQLPYTVDALCDQLGIPDYVYFKRQRVLDLGKILHSFPTSEMYTQFLKCSTNNKTNNGEICLFLVAGKSSQIITNMQTEYKAGQMVCYLLLDDAVGKVNIFKVEDAQSRQPNLFTHEGEY